MYWRLSLYELIAKVKLRYSQLHAVTLCQYSAFAEVVSAALGGSSSAPQAGIGDYEDMARGGSYDAALANINRVLSVG